MLKIIKGDKYIWSISIFLLLFSILIVYSTTISFIFLDINKSFLYILKHTIIIMLGLFIIYITHLIKYQFYFYISNLLIILSIIMLLYTFLFGTSIHQAYRWIYIPLINQTFQTSEMAIFSLLIFLSTEITIYHNSDHYNIYRMIFFLSVIITMCILVAPYNLSTSIIMFLNSLIILILGDIKNKYIILFIGIFSLLVLTLFFISPRRGVYKKRIKAFIYSNNVIHDNQYQINQSNIAISMGGLLGQGPGKSLQRYFLPSAYNDFIYAIIIEEYGLLIGGIFIILLYYLLIYRIIKIILGIKSIFGSILISALGFNIIIQALISSSISTGLLPVTGVAFPLLSMGGTSIIFNSIKLGIILNISAQWYDEHNTFNE